MHSTWIGTDRCGPQINLIIFHGTRWTWAIQIGGMRVRLLCKWIEASCCCWCRRRCAQVISHRRRLRHKLPPKLAPFAAVKLVKAYAPKVYARRKSWTVVAAASASRGIYTAAERSLCAAEYFGTFAQRNKDLSAQLPKTPELLLAAARAVIWRERRSALRHSTLKRQQTINMMCLKRRKRHRTAEK
jgi:hypothetical protein